MSFEKVAAFINGLPVKDEFLGFDDKPTNCMQRDDEDVSVERAGFWEIKGNPLNLDDNTEMNFDDGKYSYTANYNGFDTWGTRYLII